jgi:hypothetical protein
VPSSPFLVPSPKPEPCLAFGQGLKEEGFVEGQNAVVDYRYADNQIDRLPVSMPGRAIRGIWCMSTPFARRACQTACMGMLLAGAAADPQSARAFDLFGLSVGRADRIRPFTLRRWEKCACSLLLPHHRQPDIA